MGEHSSAFAQAASDLPESLCSAMALFKQAFSRVLQSQQKLVPAVTNASFSTSNAVNAADLRTTVAEKIPAMQEEVKAFRKSHGSAKIGEITVDSLYGGMRMEGLVTETSVLDTEEGIRFRGYTIPECQELLPKAPGGEEPLPEGLFWLLLTGEIPTEEQVRGLSAEWASRAELPSHVVTLLNNLPSNVHPMTQFASAIAALNSESKFAKAQGWCPGWTWGRAGCTTPRWPRTTTSRGSASCLGEAGAGCTGRRLCRLTDWWLRGRR